ncbi:uncharacterized protein LOC124271238 isoform X4 [Haliotis rubra]|nr:uncharacterized protein LOC124271238 isoform X4 [Haliotis rubra]
MATLNVIGNSGGTANTVVTVGAVNSHNNDDGCSCLKVTGVAGGVVDRAITVGNLHGSLHVNETHHTEAEQVTVTNSNVNLLQEVVLPDYESRRLQEYTRAVTGKADDVFVPTKTYKFSAACLTKASLVTIIGSPGDGKTATAYKILADYQKEGFDIFIITKPKELKYRRNPENPTIFLIDDIFGKTEVPKETFKKWKRALEELEPTLNSTFKLVMTSRDYVFNEYFKQLGFLRDSLFKEDLVVQVDLTYSEKMLILEKYISHHNLAMATVDIKQIANMSTPYGFPQTCALFFRWKQFQNDPVAFFRNPARFLQDAVRGLAEECPAKYAALLLVCADGDVCIASLTKDSVCLTQLLESKAISVDWFLENRYTIFPELCGTFLERDSDSVRLAHEAIRQAVRDVEDDNPCVR